MKDALELKSKSGIHRLITALEERGFIRPPAQPRRALEVLRLPETMTPPVRQRGFSPSVIEGSRQSPPPPTERMAMKRPPLRPVQPAVEVVDVPMMGRIAAGVPIEAIQQKSHAVHLPADMLGAGEHFALEVRGDSMVDAGIFDGDTVVVRRTAQADSGDIVVALVDGEEATLKRLRKRGNTIALESGQSAVRDPHLRRRPRQHPGQARRPPAQLLGQAERGPLPSRSSVAEAPPDDCSGGAEVWAPPRARPSPPGRLERAAGRGIGRPRPVTGCPVPGHRRVGLVVSRSQPSAVTMTLSSMQIEPALGGMIVGSRSRHIPSLSGIGRPRRPEHRLFQEFQSVAVADGEVGRGMAAIGPGVGRSRLARETCREAV
ncbi:MAG: hypothetical protein AcusKO_39880 [Acuticoccus sp.]